MNKFTKKLLISTVALGLIAPVATQAISNNPQITVNAKRRHHRYIVRRYHSAWHKGIPSVIRGHYASYSYLHGKIRHGERNLINLDSHKIALIDRGAPDPYDLLNVYTKKLGHNRYIISGHAVEALESGHSSIIITKTRRGAYIKCTNNELGGKRLTNGSYFRSRYTQRFRTLSGEI